MNEKPIRWMTILIQYQGDEADMDKLPKPDDIVNQLLEDFAEIDTKGVELTIGIDDYHGFK